MAERKIIPYIDWAERNIILDTKKPIKFQPHQKKILGHALKVGPDGRLPYSTVLYSAIKKSGKTAIGATVGLWFAYELEPGSEIICAANDLEQSSGRTFKEIKKMIDRNPMLKGRVASMTAKEIILYDGYGREQGCDAWKRDPYP